MMILPAWVVLIKLMQGLQWLPLLWPHILNIDMVAYTSNTPKVDIGSYLGLGFNLCTDMKPRNDNGNRRGSHTPRKLHPEGPSTPCLRTLTPQTIIPFMAFGIRVLQYWVLGPSGANSRTPSTLHPTPSKTSARIHGARPFCRSKK